MFGELTTTKRTIYLVLLASVFMVGFPLIILYVSGYRFSLDDPFQKRGGLYVRLPESGLKVYVDGELTEEATFLNREYYGQGLRPRNYTVRVENPEGISWTKQVEVWPNRVSNLHPVLLPEEILPEEIEPTTFAIEDGRLIRRRNDEYLSAMIRFLEEREAHERQEEEEERTRAQAEVLARMEEQEETSQTIEEALGSVADDLEVPPTTENIEKPQLETEESLSVIPKDALQYGNLYVWHKDTSVVVFYENTEDWLPQYFCTLAPVAAPLKKEVMCENPLPIATYDVPVKKIVRGITGTETVTVLLEDGRVEILEIDNREPQVRKTIFEGADDVLPVADGGLYILQGTKIFFVEVESNS